MQLKHIWCVKNQINCVSKTATVGETALSVVGQNSLARRSDPVTVTLLKCSGSETSWRTLKNYNMETGSELIARKLRDCCTSVVVSFQLDKSNVSNVSLNSFFTFSVLSLTSRELFLISSQHGSSGIGLGKLSQLKGHHRRSKLASISMYQEVSVIFYHNDWLRLATNHQSLIWLSYFHLLEK